MSVEKSRSINVREEPVENPDQQKPATAEVNSLRLVATLALAGLISGMAIIGIYEATFDTIARNKARELQAAIFKVLPGVSRVQKMVYSGNQLIATNESKKDESPVYGGYDSAGKFIGYAIPGEGPGFQDTIQLLTGYMASTGKIVGMRVLDSRETPGLGDKIIKDAQFVANFNDLTVKPTIVAVKKGQKSLPNEIDSITGATISSKAVVRIINEANEVWLSRLPEPGNEPAMIETKPGGPDQAEQGE
jgi:electron transport complex protein RnfG